jgi:hypothetical protein
MEHFDAMPWQEGFLKCPRPAETCARPMTYLAGAIVRELAWKGGNGGKEPRILRGFFLCALRRDTTSFFRTTCRSQS